MRRSDQLALGILALTTLFYLATLRQGQEWGDDFSLYLAHARNLAEGTPYADTGYIYNPAFPSLSPRTYPPVFPLLLAPVYSCFGLDLLALKREGVILFVAFLGAFYLAWRRELPPPYLLATLLLLALNPYLWQHKDRLLSEAPFLLFTTLALFWTTSAQDGSRPRSQRLGNAVLAGLAAYLAMGTRTVGVVLPAAVLLHELLLQRRLRWPVLVLLLVWAAGVGLQKVLLPLDGSYLDQLVFDPRLFADNLLSLVKTLGLFVDNGYLAWPRYLLYGCLFTLALLGFVSRLSQGTVWEVYGVLYLGVIVLWPSAGWNYRFLLPVLPLFLVYACKGLQWLNQYSVLSTQYSVLLGLLVLVSYGGCFTRLELGPLREGIGKPETAQLFDYVRTTPADAVFLFQKPRALALFTGRSAAAHHVPDDDADLWSFLRRIQATHLVVSPLFSQSYAVLQPFTERHSDHLVPVFNNPDFRVYRIR